MFDFTTPKANTTHCTKWAGMPAFHGGPVAADALAMWVAQMDFQPAPFFSDVLRAVDQEAEFGYFLRLEAFQEHVCWWYETRFGWRPNPAHVFPTHGLGNAIGITLQGLTEPGDAIIIFTPVYNEFTAKVQRNGRTVVESRLVQDDDGLFRMDLETLEQSLQGHEKIVLFSSPHNPGGRVWSAQELQALGAFCVRNDLILVSDEIHMDLVFAGHKHLPTAYVAPDATPNLIVMSAASKTFDIAGLRTGYVIIPDEDLRERWASLHRALDIQANRVGLEMTIAAYSDEGAKWNDQLSDILAGNARIFEDAINSIPGMRAASMQGTYLAWMDAKGTGMPQAELQKRLSGAARIIASPGPLFGTGGEGCMRVNIGTTRARVEDAVARIQAAFSDLQ